MKLVKVYRKEDWLTHWETSYYRAWESNPDPRGLVTVPEEMLEALEEAENLVVEARQDIEDYIDSQKEDE